MPRISIVGMVCDYDGRHTEKKKVQKIVDWLAPQIVKEAQGFICFDCLLSHLHIWLQYYCFTHLCTLSEGRSLGLLNASLQ